jgi:hypothetical protein
MSLNLLHAIPGPRGRRTTVVINQLTYNRGKIIGKFPRGRFARSLNCSVSVCFSLPGRVEEAAGVPEP